jgi:hypothetical protein
MVRTGAPPYMELLFPALPTPIEIIPASADLVRVMIEHLLTAPHWPLLRLGIVALDVAAVILIVAIVRTLKRWRRRVPWTVSPVANPHRPARSSLANAHRFAPVGTASLARAAASPATPPHRSLR